MELFNRGSGVVTVYADVACPFATLALYGLRAARRRLGRETRFDVRAFPLELINARPHDLDKTEAEKAALAGLAREMGWRSWRGARSNWPVTSLPALEAVLAAKRPEVGGLAASDELDAALRRALFGDSRCIAVIPVILEVAAECPAVDEAALADALRRGVARDEIHQHLGQQEHGAVKGSPHVFTADGHDWMNPGLVIEHADEYVVVSSYDPAAYEEILNRA